MAARQVAFEQNCENDMKQENDSDLSLDKAKKSLRDTIIHCMMEVGKFEPHTKEEAERRLDNAIFERLQRN